MRPIAGFLDEWDQTSMEGSYYYHAAHTNWSSSISNTEKTCGVSHNVYSTLVLGIAKVHGWCGCRRDKYLKQ